MRRVLYVAAFVLMAALGMAAWHRAAPRRTPSGQPPLVALARDDAAPLKDRFNSASDEVRVLLMLSPT